MEWMLVNFRGIVTGSGDKTDGRSFPKNASRNNFRYRKEPQNASRRERKEKKIRTHGKK